MSLHMERVHAAANGWVGVENAPVDESKVGIWTFAFAWSKRLTHPPTALDGTEGPYPLARTPITDGNKQEILKNQRLINDVIVNFASWERDGFLLLRFMDHQLIGEIMQKMLDAEKEQAAAQQ